MHDADRNRAREWLTLSEERRNSLYVSRMTFLRGLQFPAQFLTLTTRFNGDQYIEKFVGVDAPGTPTRSTTTQRNRPPTAVRRSGRTATG
ncbi:hypothetical protein [Haloplanus litoreus]|uniref:Uncharacterized protein n=1 Tax=Haloplanus litoreus TaxID=767515 RepID=A0ABD6A4N1_9EURY